MIFAEMEKSMNERIVKTAKKMFENVVLDVEME